MPTINKYFALALAATLVLSTHGTAQATPVAAASVTVTSDTPGTSATRLGKAEDVPHASGDTGVEVLGRRIDIQAPSSGTTGDYETLNMNQNGAVYTQLTGNQLGGLSIYRNLDIDETTGTTTQQMKASAGTLYGCSITNDTASTKEYVKFYDAVSLTGSAAGTETPVFTVPIAGATTLQFTPGGAIGTAFATGITVAATTGIADNDTGAPATNAIIINCAYK